MLISNLPAHEVLAYADSDKLWFDFDTKKQTIRGLARSYTDVDVGRALAVVGSSGFIEFSVRDGHFAQQFQRQPGDAVNLYFRV